MLVLSLADELGATTEGEKVASKVDLLELMLVNSLAEKLERTLADWKVAMLVLY